MSRAAYIDQSLLLEAAIEGVDDILDITPANNDDLVRENQLSLLTDAVVTGQLMSCIGNADAILPDNIDLSVLWRVAKRMGLSRKELAEHLSSGQKLLLLFQEMHLYEIDIEDDAPLILDMLKIDGEHVITPVVVANRCIQKLAAVLQSKQPLYDLEIERSQDAEPPSELALHRRDTYLGLCRPVLKAALTMHSQGLLALETLVILLISGYLGHQFITEVEKQHIAAHMPVFRDDDDNDEEDSYKSDEAIAQLLLVYNTSPIVYTSLVQHDLNLLAIPLMGSHAHAFKKSELMKLFSSLSPVLRAAVARRLVAKGKQLSLAFNIAIDINDSELGRAVMGCGVAAQNVVKWTMMLLDAGMLDTNAAVASLTKLLREWIAVPGNDRHPEFGGSKRVLRMDEVVSNAIHPISSRPFEVLKLLLTLSSTIYMSWIPELMKRDPKLVLSRIDKMIPSALLVLLYHNYRDQIADKRGDILWRIIETGHTAQCIDFAEEACLLFNPNSKSHCGALDKLHNVVQWVDYCALTSIVGYLTDRQRNRAISLAFATYDRNVLNGDRDRDRRWRRTLAFVRGEMFKSSIEYSTMMAVAAHRDELKLDQNDLARLAIGAVSGPIEYISKIAPETPLWLLALLAQWKLINLSSPKVSAHSWTYQWSPGAGGGNIWEEFSPELDKHTNQGILVKVGDTIDGGGPRRDFYTILGAQLESSNLFTKHEGYLLPTPAASFANNTENRSWIVSMRNLGLLLSRVSMVDHCVLGLQLHPVIAIMIALPRCLERGTPWEAVLHICGRENIELVAPRSIWSRNVQTIWADIARRYEPWMRDIKYIAEGYVAGGFVGTVITPISLQQAITGIVCKLDGDDGLLARLVVEIGFENQNGTRLSDEARASISQTYKGAFVALLQSLDADVLDAVYRFWFGCNRPDWSVGQPTVHIFKTGSQGPPAIRAQTCSNLLCLPLIDYASLDELQNSLARLLSEALENQRVADGAGLLFQNA
jgi:hypothetical protein